MASEFEYWYLKKKLPAEFRKKRTASEFREEFFSQSPASRQGRPYKTFGTYMPSVKSPIRRGEWVNAGLSTGYGKASEWFGSPLLDRSQRKQLYRYLRTRTDMVMSTLVTETGQVVLQPHHAVIESTEKGALSFILGMLGAQVAARRWLACGQRKVRRFLHTSLFANSSVVSSGSSVDYLPASSVCLSAPDFLVEDDNSDWHVFEAKGGVAARRWTEVREGILQARCTEGVGPGTPRPITTVCVHTTVEKAGVPLHFTVVDPPHSDAPEARLSFELIEPMAVATSMLEAVDWFAALDDDAEGRSPAIAALEVSPLPETVACGTKSFGGASLLLPRALVDEADQLRVRLYFARRVLDALVKEYRSHMSHRQWRLRVDRVLRRQLERVAVLGESWPSVDELDHLRDGLSKVEDFSPSDLARLMRRLTALVGLDEQVARLHDQVLSLQKLDDGETIVVTAGGLLVRFPPAG